MARFVITVNGKGIREATMQKLVDELRKKFPGDGISISVRKEEIPESRAERFAAATSMISNAQSDIEQLRDELQDRLDNMPENLQGGTKASEIEDAIAALEDCISNCEEAAGADVSFPGMY